MHLCVCVLDFLTQIGTDIQDNKCGWLIVQALKLASDEQTAILQANYGVHNDDSIAKVKDLYKELNIEKVRM